MSHRGRAIGVLAACALVLGAIARPPSATACSGAAPVEATDLLHHTGAIVVVEVLERLGRAEEPRSIVLGVRETLRGSTTTIFSLDRPTQAVGVCHDVFTGRIRSRMLLALGVRTSSGLVLDPAWQVAADDELKPIYDELVPWPTLAEARTALATGATTQPAELPLTSEDAAWIVEPLLAGGLLLGVVALFGRWRARSVVRR